MHRTLFLFPFLFLLLLPSDTNLLARQEAQNQGGEQGAGKVGLQAIKERTEGVAGAGGFNIGETDLASIIGTVINTILGMVGVMFMVGMIKAGVQWMNAGGNEESVTKAKTTIINSTIGILIILSAYAINRFVFGLLVG